MQKKIELNFNAVPAFRASCPCSCVFRVPAYSGFPVSVCTNSLIAIFIKQNLRFHTGRLGMILTP